MPRPLRSALPAFAALAALAACDPDATLDDRLAAAIAPYDAAPLPPKPALDPERVALGRLLFFDPVLSGNRDTSCATCHHPRFGTGDALSVSVGTGGLGLGPDRQLGPDRGLIPRNAPEVYNRGTSLWTTMFWDSRVTHNPDGTFTSPAGAALPAGLDSVLAIQAMFPVTSRDEMRGLPGDLDVFGAPNELAAFADTDWAGLWAALMERLLALDGYAERFARAFPDVPPAELGFEHAALALAAFEADAFTFTDSPWDRWLRGERDALTDAQKRGALVFYGEAGCADCHSGALMTDQKTWSLCVPQIGPGKGAAAPWDIGHGAVTGAAADRFAFRTPPLRNVDHTGPWMHDGAYTSLEDAVRHHLDPVGALRRYDPSALRADVRDTLQDDEELMGEMLATLPPELREARTLDDRAMADLLAFLSALTDPASLRLGPVTPVAVPSGLPVDRGL